MADTFTSTLRLQQPTVGADAATWGGYLNTDLVLIDNAINGVAAINIAGLASYSLTVANGAVDQARNLVYNFTGALSANCTVTLPANVKYGWATNTTTGGHAVILTTGVGNSLTLPTSAYNVFFSCDGTNVFAPSVGFGYTNILNDLLVSGNLNVNGLTGIGGLTAGATTVSSLNSTGTVTIGTSTYGTNGDGFVPFMNLNRSSIINQAVRSDSSVSFTDVNLVGLGFLKASFIDQPVLTTSSPVFADVGITGIGFIKANLINQALLTGSNVTFNNVYVSGLGDYITNFINQRLRTIDSPTFNNVGLTYLGNSLAGVLDQDVRNVATPTFNNISLTYLGNNLAGVLNQDVRNGASPSFGNPYFTIFGDSIGNRLGQDVRSGSNPSFASISVTGVTTSFSTATGSGTAYHASNGSGLAVGGWLTGSDISFKTDIEPLTGSLDKITAVDGVSYTHKKMGGRHLGVIGQEVQKHFPEAVEEKDGKLYVNYGMLVAPLIEAVKELRAEIATLKAQMA